MARSKEQWKARKKGTLYQPQTKSAFLQMTRPGAPPPGVRPSAPSNTDSALFQLGFPTSVPVPVPVPVLETSSTTVKPDPIQTPSAETNMNTDLSGVIDLTVEDDEEEDQPMGQTDQKVTEAVGEHGADSSAAAGSLAKEPASQVKPTEPALETTPELGEEVESDVDEAWPSVTSLTFSRARRRKEEKGTTMECASGSPNTHNKADMQQGRISLEDSDEEMEADVDEELPSQTPRPGESNSTSSDISSACRIVEPENLEDGEIYEEGAGPELAVKVLHETDPKQERFRCDDPVMNAANYMGIRTPQLRGKKQKKRGKKKPKRKLEAVQMKQVLRGENLLVYEPAAHERITRPRLYGDTPPPRPYALTMMKNGPASEPVNARPVLHCASPAQFYPGSHFVGAPRPLMPPPQHRPGAMPPLPFDDSQILRVNREGNLEMLDGGGNLPSQKTFLERPRYGGFKYRSAPNSPPKAVPSGLNRLLQPLVMTSNSALPPLPGAGRGVPPDLAIKERHDDLGDFDLDSLRAAALRTKRPKISKFPATKNATNTSCSSSPASPDFAQRRHSEPSSPEIDDMRAEILRSIQRNRQQAAMEATDKIPTPMPPVVEEKVIKNYEINIAANREIANARSTGVSDNCASGGSTFIASKQLSGCTLSMTSDTTAINGDVANEPSHDPIAPAATPGKGANGKGNIEPGTPATSKFGLAVQLEATTPEYRPLTACSQSVVIRLSLDDFSPRKIGEDTRQASVKANLASSAIDEMRRQIAEHEKKKRTTRLLEKGMVKMARQPLSPLSPQVSSSQDEATGSGKPQTTATSAPVSLTQSAEATQSATVTTGVDTTPSTDSARKVKALLTAQPFDTSPPTEQEIDQAGSAATTQIIPKQQELSIISGDDSVLPNAGCEFAENANDEPLVSSDLSPAKLIDSELDLDTIRAEYEQCVAECEEADAQIARLSREMAELEKQLPAVATT